MTHENEAKEILRVLRMIKRADGMRAVEMTTPGDVGWSDRAVCHGFLVKTDYYEVSTGFKVPFKSDQYDLTQLGLLALAMSETGT